MKQKKNVRKGNRTITIAFYTVYVVMVAAIAAALLYADRLLEEQLIKYENSHPSNCSESIFQEYFANPDWTALYSMAGLKDTAFEGSEAFAAYMEAKVAGRELTFAEEAAETSGGHKYLLLVGDSPIGWFTMVDRAPAGSPYPQWYLGEVMLTYTYRESVTVQKPENTTVFVNGVALTNQDTVSILISPAEDYLPEGISAPRTHVQYLEGLMVEPVITAEDSAGNALDVIYDPDSDLYRVDTGTPAMGDSQSATVLNTAKAYARYQLRQISILDLRKYFDTTSESWDYILAEGFWSQQSPAAGCEWGEEVITGYCLYAEYLFSVHVRLPLSVNGADGNSEAYLVDHDFLFRLQNGAWKCIFMTPENSTQHTAFVRVTYMLGDTVIFTNLYHQDTAVLEPPVLSTPAGQVFAGWFRRETGTDGSITYTLVFGPDEMGPIALNSPLEPVTLYALYQDAE